MKSDVQDAQDDLHDAVREREKAENDLDEVTSNPTHLLILSLIYYCSFERRCRISPSLPKA